MGKRIALKQFRVGLDLSQEELAQKLGVSRLTYATIELGKNDGSMSFWFSLQREYNLTPGKLWGLMKIEQV